MRTRARSRTVAVVTLAAAVAAVWPVSATAQAPNDQPLDSAARAAQQLTFSGVVLVHWTDGPTPHLERLEVEGAGGSVVVHGGTAVMASAKQRLVAHGSGPWNLLWPSAGEAAARPSTRAKYELVDIAPATVSGRPARVVEARHEGVLVERLYVDVETGLLLRREHFEGTAGPDRTVEFESVTIGGSPASLAPPAQVVDHASKALPQPVASGVSAPASLADGYVRMGLYRTSDAVQVQYNDGLYDLSVFQQEGRLDRDNLRAGERVSIGRASGRHYEWAGGHVLLWQRSGMVYTAVSDAPLDQVLEAVRSLPPVSASASFVSRLRQVCRSLVQPFAD